jgi:hypothetical protein
VAHSPRALVAVRRAAGPGRWNRDARIQGSDLTQIDSVLPLGVRRAGWATRSLRACLGTGAITVPRAGAAG